MNVLTAIKRNEQQTFEIDVEKLSNVSSDCIKVIASKISVHGNKFGRNLAVKLKLPNRVVMLQDINNVITKIDRDYFESLRYDNTYICRPERIFCEIYFGRTLSFIAYENLLRTLGVRT